MKRIQCGELGTSYECAEYNTARWAVIYRAVSDEPQVHYACGKHLNRMVERAEQYRHPLHHIQVMKLKESE